MTKARDLANVISGSGTLNANVIPALPASKITSGTIDNARITLDAAEIPDLPASKITSGTFADARLASSNVTQHVDLSNLSASNLTSGTVPSARLSLSASDVPDLATSKITSGTFADARLSASSVTQHVDLTSLSADNLTSGTVPSARLSLGASDIPNLATSKITSGTFDNARISSGSVTQHVSAVNVNTGSWSPSYTNWTCSTQNARYVRVGRIVNVVVYFLCTNYSATDNFIRINNLPYTSWNSGTPVGSGFVSGSDIGNKSYGCYVKNNSTQIFLRGGDGRKAIGSGDSQGTIRGHDAQYMSTQYKGSNQAYHVLSLTYISAS